MLISLLFSEPLMFIPLILALLISLTVHEVSHGVVALWLGDTTARDAGRLTFNPINHLDPVGFILLLTIGFGWGNPVPVNYYNLKYPKWGPALVSIAGPISNLLLVILVGIIFKVLAPAGLNPLNIDQVISSSGSLMFVFLAFMMFYNIILMVFNLIPVPPLDGSKVLLAILPEKYSRFKFLLQTRGPIILFALLIIDSFANIGIFSAFFSGIINFFSRFF